MAPRPKNPALLVDQRRSRVGYRTAIAPRGPLVIPPPPATLETEAHETWRAIWSAGGGAYSVTTDARAVERYAETQLRRRRLLAILDAEGWITVGSQGQPVAHPAAKLLDAVDSRLLALEDRLGLNPEARLRLGLAAVERQSKLAAFLAGDE